MSPGLSDPSPAPVETTKVALIGAGPIGLEMAVAFKRAGVNYLHFEAGQIGQTVSWYPRQVRFFSSPERIAIAGVPLQTVDQAKASREEYLAYLRGVVEQFDLAVRTYEPVTAITRQDERGGDSDGFTLRTRRAGTGRVCHAARVVLAIGDMHRPRLLGVPGEDLPHVSHYFEEPHPYFRRRLLIVGGRNSAAEAAIRCQRAGASVALSYRRAEFDAQSIKYWLMPELDGLIKTGKLAFYPQTVPTRITPTHVTLAPTAEAAAEAGDREPFDVPTDFVLSLIGYEMDPRLLEMAGVRLEGENRAPVLDPDTMETNVPGLYVAGTAAAGTQLRFRLFIENCHPHVAKILAALTGRRTEPRVVVRPSDMPES